MRGKIQNKNVQLNSKVDIKMWKHSKLNNWKSKDQNTEGQFKWNQ